MEGLKCVERIGSCVEIHMAGAGRESAIDRELVARRPVPVYEIQHHGNGDRRNGVLDVVRRPGTACVPSSRFYASMVRPKSRSGQTDSCDYSLGAIFGKCHLLERSGGTRSVRSAKDSRAEAQTPRKVRGLRISKIRKSGLPRVRSR